MLVITTDNGFNGKVNLVNGTYLSTKEQHTGLGLDSIIQIAENHNGNAEFSHEGCTFHVSVAIQL